jgi:hypothetical protein
MAKKKEPLGYKTPSMQIQEEYKEILEQIMAKKANWENILTHTLSGANDALKRTNDLVKKLESKKEVTHEDITNLENGVLLLAHFATLIMVAKVGKKLAECDVRISEVEKDLKELRRGLK